MRIVVTGAFAALLVLGACGRGAGADAAGAASFAAMGVGLAAADRKLTRDCWGQCLNGLMCDHERGVCVEHAPCGGRCRGDERCEEGAVGRCVPILGLVSGQATDAAPPEDAAVGGDAGADGSGS
jgi:hypothetical protein